MSLSSRARAVLEGAAPDGTPEGRLYSAALETLATGATVDPDLAALVESVPSDDLFRGVPPHGDQLVERVRALEDVTLLAIARGADETLRSLEALWAKDRDPAIEWRTGWIRLFTKGAGLDEDAITFLVGDSMVFPDTIPDSAWLALHRGRENLAREALDAMHEASAKRCAAWQQNPDLAIQASWYQPRWVLKLDERAVESILARWFSPK